MHFVQVVVMVILSQVNETIIELAELLIFSSYAFAPRLWGAVVAR